MHLLWKISFQSTSDILLRRHSSSFFVVFLFCDFYTHLIFCSLADSSSSFQPCNFMFWCHSTLLQVAQTASLSQHLDATQGDPQHIPQPWYFRFWLWLGPLPPNHPWRSLTDWRHRSRPNFRTILGREIYRTVHTGPDSYSAGRKRNSRKSQQCVLLCLFAFIYSFLFCSRLCRCGSSWSLWF